MIDESGQPLITHPGLTETTTGDSELAKTGAVPGTPSHMFPEQAQNTETVTMAVENYAIGANMYELLMG